MTEKTETHVYLGEGYLIKRDGDVIGYITDSSLAEHIDGLDIVVDGMYEHQEYDIEPVPNDDIA